MLLLRTRVPSFENKGVDFGVDLDPIRTLGSIAIRGSAGAEKAIKTDGFSILFIKTYEKP